MFGQLNYKNVSIFGTLSDSFNGELGMIDISKLENYYPVEFDFKSMTKKRV